MSDIFVSYDHEDTATAKRIKDALEQVFKARGLSVWWDPDLYAGERYRQTILRQLEAARCVVVLWSQHSIGSDWVNQESTKANDRGLLLSVYIEDVEAPLPFGETMGVNLVGWQRDLADSRFVKLVDSIEHHLAGGGGLRTAPVKPPVSDPGGSRRALPRPAMIAFAIALLVGLGSITYWIVTRPGSTGQAGDPIGTEAGSSGSAEVARIYGGRPVTLHYHAGDLLTILRDCARQAGITLAPLPGLSAAPTTVETAGTALAEAMDQICYGVCSWEFRGTPKRPLLLVSPNATAAPATPAPSADRRP